MESMDSRPPIINFNGCGYSEEQSCQTCKLENREDSDEDINYQKSFYSMCEYKNLKTQMKLKEFIVEKSFLAIRKVTR